MDKHTQKLVERTESVLEKAGYHKEGIDWKKTVEHVVTSEQIRGDSAQIHIMDSSTIPLHEAEKILTI